MRGSSAVRARRRVLVVTCSVLLGGAACTPLGQSETVEVGPDPRSALALTPPPSQPQAPDTSVAPPATPSTTTPPTTTVAPPPTSTTVAPTVAPPTTAVPAPVVVPAAPSLAPSHAQALQRLSSPGSISVASQALALVRFDWASSLPGWQLRFLDGRSGFRGLTFPDRRVIEVYVRAGDSPQQLAHVVAHELGHAVDVTHLSEVDRGTWRAARGFGSSTIWFAQAAGASDFATAAGDFAESFAWIHAPTGHWYSQLSAPPDFAQAAVLGVISQPG
ncbi:MAG: hypothetical protein ACK4V6_21365 [Microthrixaceae bacterium]